MELGAQANAIAATAVKMNLEPVAVVMLSPTLVLARGETTGGNPRAFYVYRILHLPI
jgi:hypothetical protein